MRQLLRHIPISACILATCLGFFGADAAAVADEKCTIKPEWKIDSVRLPLDPSRSPESYVELGDVIAVTSAGLPELRKCASSANPVLLYLNGMPLRGMLEDPPSNPQGQDALYTLKIGPENRPVWNRLLGSPSIGTTTPVRVSLGLADGFALPSDAKNVALRPLPPIGFALWVVLFVVGLIAFFWLARVSNLIRGGTPVGGRAFSLSRSQAAWWFFLILAAYLLIGLTTGDYTNSLNQTALTLLGIASGTYLGSAAVDASKSTPADLAAQEQEKSRIRAVRVDARTPSEQDKFAKLNGESQGWFKDVLSDSEGVDFHRFQMLVWTIVLGIIFVVRVWQDLAMPEFGAALLALTGLSSGTYVGLKISETTS